MLRRGAVVVVLFAVAGISHALSDAEKAVKPKSECDAKASNCLSFPNSFKCAMAFKNLGEVKYGKGKYETKILDIIPDLINQPGVELTDEIKVELEEREINFPAFDIADVCGNKIQARKRSNARCYAFLQDYAEEPLDSCDTGLITSDGEEINEGTVGDALCERAFNFNLTFLDEAAREEQYHRVWEPSTEIKIGAYHSYCGTDWQEVATGTGKSRKPLDLELPLCCVRFPDPRCKDGVITSLGFWPKCGPKKGPCERNARPLKEGQTCEKRPQSLGCPCPQKKKQAYYKSCNKKPFNRKCDKKN